MNPLRQETSSPPSRAPRAAASRGELPDLTAERLTRYRVVPEGIAGGSPTTACAQHRWFPTFGERWKLRALKHVGRLLSLFSHPHAELLRQLTREQPQHILLIPALLRTRKLGHALVSDGPLVHSLLATSPTTRVTIVTNQPELWNSAHGRLSCVPADEVRALLSSPLPTAKERLTSWAKQKAFDTVVNLADEADESLLVGMTGRYVSLTGRSVGDDRPTSALRSRLRYSLVSGICRTFNRTAFGDSLIRAVTGSAPEGWRHSLFCDPQDKPNTDLQSLAERRRPLLLVNLYGSGKARSWYHLPSAASFLRRLIDETATTVVLAAPLNDRQRQHQVALLSALSEHHRHRVVTVQDPTLRTLKRLILLCDETLTVDSGAAHLAYGLGRSPLVLSQWFATVGHPFGAWHPEPTWHLRRAMNGFSPLPSRFNPEMVLRLCRHRFPRAT